MTPKANLEKRVDVISDSDEQVEAVNEAKAYRGYVFRNDFETMNDFKLENNSGNPINPESRIIPDSQINLDSRINSPVRINSPIRPTFNIPLT